MKKLVTLLAAAGMIVSAAAPASAVDVKVDARYRLSFATGSDFKGANKEDMRHRMRLGLTMAASENLSAYVQFQINHKNAFGNTTNHGDTGLHNQITARMLYLDWTVPGTPVKVRMGRHDLGLPSEAFGTNSILGGGGYGNREGIVVNAPVTDWLGLTAQWVRLAIDVAEGAGDLDKNKSDDMYALSANLKFDGISGAVYTAYATMDGEEYKTKTGWNSGAPEGEGKAWWAGFTSTFSYFDPFTLKLSAAYGSFDSDETADKDQDGWNVQAKASYKTAFGTPVLGAWYFSGQDDKDAKDGYMPNAGYFAGTNHFYDNFASLTNPSQTNNLGTWAVQAGIEGVSFLEGLNHDFHVTYLEGTNDKDCVADPSKGFLTEDDAQVEITLNNTYKIYKNLTARLELAYIINDYSDKTQDAGFDEDDWYTGLTFDFRF